MSSFEGYVVKALHADDVEETLPLSQPMVDAAEKRMLPLVVLKLKHRTQSQSQDCGSLQEKMRSRSTFLLREFWKVVVSTSGR